MQDATIWQVYGEAAKTSLGFFWKAGWAFVLGYFVSGMIQAFVPKNKLTRHMGAADLRGVALATAFGSASSSCSFAALAAARSLVLKGAHFVAAVAFMFASTNLVIELGILILIFLGWQFLAAEIIGGLVLIAISSLLIRATYPEAWLNEAREKVSEETGTEEQNFDWRERIRSRRGWRMVGHNFVMDWRMVWKEILIGFTIAGFVAVVVPAVLVGPDLSRGYGVGAAGVADRAGERGSGAVRGGRDLHRVHGQHSAGDRTECQRCPVRGGHGLHLFRSDGAPSGRGQRQVLRLAGGAVHRRRHVCEHRRHRPDPERPVRPARDRPRERQGGYGGGSVQARLHLLAQSGFRRHRRMAGLSVAPACEGTRQRWRTTWKATAP